MFRLRSMLLLFLLSSCSVESLVQIVFPPEPTVSYRYTDEQALAFAEQLARYDFEAGQIPIGAADTLFAQIGLDVADLPQRDRIIGNCLDVTVYNVSPHYELRVDNNACFGVHIEIRGK